MYPWSHFLFPFVIGLILTKTDHFTLPLALLAGIIGALVDLDHYIEHIVYAKTNRFSLKATWNNSIKLHRFEQRSFIHYSLGALWISLFLLVLSRINLMVAAALALGYYSHLLLDLPHFESAKKLKIKLFHLYLQEPLVEILFDVVLVGIVFTNLLL
ncbi:metal-dependent hydrolase [Candidatus Woesearchaeota archaeon]|nr:metal-dependent hydrolase [Candidatus Woesearchaeota archaeon]